VAEGVVLGIDLGTAEAKAALVTLDGRLLGLGRAAIPTDAGPDGRAEQDPRRWWAAVAAAIRSIEALADGTATVLAICGTGQGPTLAVLDEDAGPVRPAITWQDRRPASTGFGLLPRVAWLAREEPDAIAEARWLLPSWDALGLWLTGEAATALQAHESPASADEIEAAGARPSQVPVPLPSGAPLGWLRPEAAEVLGLPARLPVVAGINDGMASVLGAGIREPGEAVDTGGTSGGLAICHDRAVSLPGLYCAPAPLPGRWILGGAMAALGASVEWLRSRVLGGAWTPDELFAAAASVPPGADGLVFLPYLAGERAPIFDERARGAFVGLTLSHGPAHLARAVLEGGAFAVRHVAEPFVSAGVPLVEVRPAGRPAPDDAWARIKADVLGVPAAIPTVGETAVLGAAILAAAGVEAVPDLETGVREMTSIERRIEPDPAAHARYDALFAVYRDLYPALAPSFGALGTGSGSVSGAGST
jgi:xylulokinase